MAREDFQPRDLTVVPRFADIVIFLKTRRYEPAQDIDIGLAGVPFDITERKSRPAVSRRQESIRHGEPGDGVSAEDAEILSHMNIVDEGCKTIIVSGVNLQLVNGMDDTQTTNCLGNLIVGYNEDRVDGPFPPLDAANDRTGSHNLIVGPDHTYSSYGGLVAGYGNTISGDHSSVSGGHLNTASGTNSSVSGGNGNEASAWDSSVSGGALNTASNTRSSVSGGEQNTASGDWSSVSGGHHNLASGPASSVSGGTGSLASGDSSSVSGGDGNRARGSKSSVSGGRLNEAIGDSSSSVSGGQLNTASGNFSSVSGGNNVTVSADNEWSAGSSGENISAEDVEILGHMSIVDDGCKTIVVSGVNFQLVNGMDDTETTNCFGNLIVGYNEDEIDAGVNDRSGSHNLIIGPDHTYSSYGGLVAGRQNTISGINSTVSGGHSNEASGDYSSVSGGRLNTASGFASSILGGDTCCAIGSFTTPTGNRGSSCFSCP